MMMQSSIVGEARKGRDRFRARMLSALPMSAPTYLIDSCVCIRVLRGSSAPAMRRIAAADPGTIAMSAISHAELVAGAARRGEAGLAALDRLIGTIPVIAFDAAAARAYPAARAARGRHDRLIAAHALSLGAVLVTDNVGDFRPVAGLRVEHWR